MESVQCTASLKALIAQLANRHLLPLSGCMQRSRGVARNQSGPCEGSVLGLLGEPTVSIILAGASQGAGVWRISDWLFIKFVAGA